MVTTTREGFDTVSQSGSKQVWNSISDMPYSTEGDGYAILTAANQVSNTLNFIIPHEAVNIPVGAMFNSMEIFLSVKKTGTFSAATNVLWTGGTSYSAYTPWTYTLTTDESYVNLSPGGDKAYWQMSAFSDTAIITALKSGALYHTLKAQTTSAVACDVYVNAVTITITYTTVEGKRAAVLIPLI